MEKRDAFHALGQEEGAKPQNYLRKKEKRTCQGNLHVVNYQSM